MPSCNRLCFRGPSGPFGGSRARAAVLRGVPPREAPRQYQARGQLPKIVGRYRGRAQEPYTVTDEDRLWLLRAVEGEGPVHDQVAQCLVNRFLFLRTRRPGVYTTLTDLVRAYSQPVNPRWLKGGDRFDSTYEAASALQRRAMDAQHRRRLAHQARTKFSPETTQAVDKALRDGSLDIPPNAVHFAAPGVGGRGMSPVARPKRANWLYATQGSRFWQGYRGT